MCDGKWEEHVTLYEDEEIRREAGKAVGTEFYPLADNPDIQAEFLRQLEEEAEAATAVASEDATTQLEQGVKAVSLINETSCTELTQPKSLKEKQKFTLPQRDQPEKSVRLMQEQGMLRKYNN